ncbi:MAG: hypothetical protein NTW67_01905 [Candidatus Woesearchaeota archaeon]|nr:hypothetical protein [Candidatus Woesearchaeota archaeon]
MDISPDDIRRLRLEVPNGIHGIFVDAALDWQKLSEKERTLLQQKEHSFKAYLTAHSIDYTKFHTENPHADWNETTMAQELRNQKESYLSLAAQLQKAIENKEGRRNYFKFSDTLDQLVSEGKRIESILIAEEAGRDHFNDDRKTVTLIPEYKERYNNVFLPISLRADKRRRENTTLPIYYVKMSEGNITGIFYVHFVHPLIEGDHALQNHITERLTKLSRTKNGQYWDEFALIQSNIARAPTEIEDDKVLKGLGLQPKVITLDYSTKAKA